MVNRAPFFQVALSGNRVPHFPSLQLPKGTIYQQSSDVFRYQTHFWVPMRLTRAPNLAEFERVSVRGRLRCWRAKSVDLIDFKRLFFALW